MSEPNRPISDAELVVLKALWDVGDEGATVRTLHETVRSAGNDWAYTTVQTLLQRLEEKGYVRKDASERAHVFKANQSRDSLVDAELDDLMDRLCEGAASPLLLSLVQRRSFTSEEIRAFRDLLEQMEENDAKSTKTGQNRAGRSTRASGRQRGSGADEST